MSTTIAVLIPCRDEETTVAKVVSDFHSALPGATVYVYDNGSTDATVERALAAGAVVRHEERPGKGRVVRRMFADVDADVYVLVDGDDTYEPAAAAPMVKLLLDEQLDMVVGRRVADDTGTAYRRGHTFGNRMFNRTLHVLFGSHFKDVLSGYRVMSRRFVKSLPVTSSGFEIETELTTHAVDVEANCIEVDTAYRARPEESESSLHTYRDGMRILRKTLTLFRELRPLRFYAILTVLLTIVAFSFGTRVLIDYLNTGEVPHFPTAFLAASIQIVAFVSLTTGIILDAFRRARSDARRLAYLAIPHPTASAS